MNSAAGVHGEFQSGTMLVEGPAGQIEVVIDAPGDFPRGIAVVAHPQPLLGGSAKHKVPQLLARAIRDAGWLAARPNFRGVGVSQGTYDEGIGETDDVLALVRHLRAAFPDQPLALVEFSFGAFVQSRVVRVLTEQGEGPHRVVLAALPVGRVEGQRNYAPPVDLPNTLIVHGEYDEIIALKNVLDWARPQSQPVVVVPGADHFFTGCLPVLRQLALSHLAS